MKATILNGVKIAEQLKIQLKEEVKNLKVCFKQDPCLLSINIGNTHASDVYLKAQERTAQELGITFIRKDFHAQVAESEIIQYILKKNNDPLVTSLMLQQPLPKGFDQMRLVEYIDFRKDAEGIHPENLGKIFLRKGHIGPCTAMAAMECIKASGVSLYGKEAVIVGHSDIVGKPLSIFMLKESATVTVCHLATAEKGFLEKHIRRAEVLVVAVGKPLLIKGSSIRSGATVIDVGINHYKGKIVGDVDFEAAQKRAAFITPVPGGVGKLTVVMLMRNVIEQFKAHYAEGHAGLF